MNALSSIYRSPTRTLVSFILLCIMSFLFTTQAIEYSSTRGEYRKTVNKYMGVGAVEAEPPAESDTAFPFFPTTAVPDEDYLPSRRFYTEGSPVPIPLNETDELLYKALNKEQIAEVEALPYVTSTSIRYMTSGISSDYYRMDDGSYFFNYSARCIIEGRYVLTHNQLGPDMLVVEDFTILAGNTTRLKNAKTTGIWAINSTFNGYSSFMSSGYDRGLMWFDSNNKYAAKYRDILEEGKKYAFVIRFEPLEKRGNGDNQLGDHFSEYWCESVWQIEGYSDNYLELDEFAPLRELIEITNADMHTFDVVYTDDMSMIMRFAQELMVIKDGRALVPEDDDSDAYVCVISSEVASSNIINIGDTISLALGSRLFVQYKPLGAVSATRDRYEPPTKTVDLEVVGIYSNVDSALSQSKTPHWSYSINTIFVPLSLLPTDEETISSHEAIPSEYSFKVENAASIKKFLEEAKPILEDMGLTLYFSDGGWLDIESSYKEAMLLISFRVAASVLSVVAVVVLVEFLFFIRRRSEYAIMRALGKNKKTSARTLTIPLMLVVATAVVIGGIASLIYSRWTTAEINAIAPIDIVLARIDITAFVTTAISVLGQLALTIFVARIMLNRIGARPVLELLHEQKSKK